MKRNEVRPKPSLERHRKLDPATIRLAKQLAKESSEWTKAQQARFCQKCQQPLAKCDC